MAIKLEHRPVTIGHGPRLLAFGGLTAALAASSCCILPVLLFSLGIGGAWIANFTRLAPYQPIFVATSVACIGAGSWLVYRSSKRSCVEGDACARPLPSRLVTALLIVATAIVIATFGFDYLAPYLLS